MASYPTHFAFLFFVVLIEGAVAILSILAVVPLADFLLDASLLSPSRVTEVMLEIVNYIGIKPNFWLFGFFFVAVNVLKGVMDVVLRYTVLHIKYAVCRGLIGDALQTFFKARWTFFSSADGGRMLNTFSKELATIGDTLGAIATLLAQIIQFIIYLSVPFWLNPYLTSTTLGLVLLLGSPFLLLQRVSYRLGVKNTETANVAMGILSEVIAGARLILGFGRQKLARKNYLNAFDNHIHVTLRSQTLMILVPSLFRPIGMLAVIIAMGFAIRQGTKVSELAAVLWSLLASLPILSQMLQGNISIKNFLPSYEQLVSLREQAKLSEEVEGSNIFKKMEKGIEFRDVHFTYPGRNQTLQGVNLKIRKGQITALVGESGSGKSTITDLVLGLQIPEKGEVQLDGLSLSNWKLNSFREHVGYVPQDPFLFHTSIRENLLWSYDKVTEKELFETCQLANAEEFIQKLPEGIDTIVGDRGVRLSGGQRQRIALARALLRKPELLIFDEATSALDTESERLIQQSIEKVAHDTTILIIAHRLSTITNADMVYVIRKGSIVEKGSYSNLSKLNGPLSTMINTQHHD